MLFFTQILEKGCLFQKQNVFAVKKSKNLFFKIFLFFFKSNYFRRLEAATGLSTDNKEEPFMIGTLDFFLPTSFYSFKDTVSVFSSDPPCKDDKVHDS